MIQALRRLRQEDDKWKTNLSCSAGHCGKKNNCVSETTAPAHGKERVGEEITFCWVSVSSECPIPGLAAVGFALFVVLIFLFVFCFVESSWGIAVGRRKKK